MVRYISLLLFIGLILGQKRLLSKSKYFLSNISNLQKVDSNISDQINKELKKMINDAKSEIDLGNNFWKEKYSDRVFVRQERDLDAINKALEMDRALMAGMNIYEKKAHMDLIEYYGTKNIYKDVPGERNKSIKINKIVYQNRPSWDNVVKHYGGYSELTKKGIEKQYLDSGRFDVQSELISIDLINSKECIANVKISGELKINKVPKDSYKYKGTYQLSDINIPSIYNSLIPEIEFSFPDKKYMVLPEAITIPVTEFGFKTIDETLNKYKLGMIQMIEDMVTDSMYHSIDDIKFIVKREEEERIARLKREEEERIARKKREKKRKRSLFAGYATIVSHSFDNMAYNNNIGKRFNLETLPSFGFSAVFSPIKFDIHYSMTNYIIEPPVIFYYPPGVHYINDEAIVTLYGDYEEITGQYQAINFSASYDILPDFFLRPYIGIGYQSSGFILHDPTYAGNHDLKSPTSDFFFNGELCIRPFSFFYLGMRYQRSLTIEDKAWNSVGFNSGLMKNFFELWGM